MHRIVLPAVLLSIVFTHVDLHLLDANCQDESREPPIEFVVKVADKSVAISEGKSATLKGEFTDPVISIEPRPFRVFPYGGVRFNYPRTFSYEAEFSDTGSKTWILSGNDLKIMVFAISGEMSAREFSENMIRQFGGGKSKITDDEAEIVLGAETLRGCSLRVLLATHQMSMDIYRISTPGSELTKLLVIQDGQNKLLEHTDEGKRTLAEMKKSFRIEPKR